MRDGITIPRWLFLFALGCVCARVNATDLKPLDDADLSDVRGRDGVSFGVNLNANIGNVTLGATDSAGNAGSIMLNNVIVSGTIASTLDLTAGINGNPSYINWASPNIAGANSIQFGFDLAVNANGTTLGTGVQFQNVAFGGSSLQMTPYVNGGITFGSQLSLQVGNVLLQPNGRGITTGQMAISGLVIGAAGSNGTAPWVTADINAQPGIINIVTDSSGNPNLQWGIGWPTASGTAPAGSLQISNITFTTPDGNVNLGSSSIGSMQIQYLNVKLKN
jgi:hypothetical protein